MVTNRIRSAAASAVERFGSPAVLLATVWVTDFLHLLDFGLYEDDFTFIPQAVTMDLAELARFIGSYLVHLYGHGRPLSDSLISLFSFIGWRIAGLTGVYLIGFSIVALNVLLFYSILRRVGSEFAALAGGLAFALFPADTTQPFLTHSLGLQPSLTFLLLAYHAYLSERRVLSYAVILGSLFCYETAFPVFLGAPLLTGDLNRRKVRELTGHAIIMGALIGSTILLRLSVGEDRVTGLEFPSVVLTPLRHMVVGPLVTLGAFWLRPVQAILGADPEVLVFMTVFFGLFLWVLNRSKNPPLTATLAVGLQLAGQQLRANRFGLGRAWSSTPPEARTWLRHVLAGLALLVLAYPLTFNIRSFSLSGRDTRVHLAAVVGGPLLFSCAASVLDGFVNRSRTRSLAHPLLGAWLALLLGFGLVVQRDYVRAWRAQQAFWSDLVQLVPDAGPGTVILIDPGGLRDFKQIDANAWNMPRLLHQIYQTPAGWVAPPRVYRLVPGWQAYLVTPEGAVLLDNRTVDAPPSLYGEFSPADMIFIETGSSQLFRGTDKVDSGEQELALKPKSSPILPTLPPGFLHPLLLGRAGNSHEYLTEG